MENEEEKVIIKLHKMPLASEKKERRRKALKIILSCFLALFVFIVGAVVGYIFAFKGRITVDTGSFSNKIREVETYFNQLWLYKDDHEGLNNEMEDKAIRGMTQFEEDPYTTYMSNEELEDFANSINMNYVGIGAQYNLSNNVATITRVYKDSPAEAGGLLAGDIINSVNGKSIEGLTTNEIKAMITGQEGSEVKIEVIRSGVKKELSFIRGAIDTTVYAKAQDDYVVLEIMSFGENTAEECVKYLNEYKDYSKLIIDLRDNTGGYQQSLQSVAGLFLGPDVIVLNETFNTGETKSYKSYCLKHFDNFEKIVVLTNGNTASAAEVLTITLKELHPNCIQVGETTYGKGVVQSTIPLSDGSCVKITTSYWTSPKGVSINKNGVVPDVEVKLDELLYKVVYAMGEEDIYDVDDVSSYIGIAQQSLNYLSYKTNRDDGYFDESTAIALKRFQSDNNLETNGKLDSITYETLISRVIYEYNMDPNKDVQMLKAIELVR